jgi:hypothetical protein
VSTRIGRFGYLAWAAASADGTSSAAAIAMGAKNLTIEIISASTMLNGLA